MCFIHNINKNAPIHNRPSVCLKVIKYEISVKQFLLTVTVDSQASNTPQHVQLENDWELLCKTNSSSAILQYKDSSLFFAKISARLCVRLSKKWSLWDLPSVKWLALYLRSVLLDFTALFVFGSLSRFIYFKAFRNHLKQWQVCSGLFVSIFHDLLTS